MAQPSPLLRLAPELRNAIWYYTVVEDEIDVTGYDWACEPAVLATCKQIREEAMDIYYAENTFITRAWNETWFSNAYEPFDWLSILGKEKCSMIINFRIVLLEEILIWSAASLHYGGRTWSEVQLGHRLWRRLKRQIVWRMKEVFDYGLRADAISFEAVEMDGPIQAAWGGIYWGVRDEVLHRLREKVSFWEGVVM